MKRLAGFTLLEMMITLLVLAVGVLGLLRLQTELLHSQIAANDYNTATNLAQAVLEERHSGAQLSCLGASYAPYQSSGPLARFQCLSAAAGGMLTVRMRWTDSQGDANELSLSAPILLQTAPPPK
ncbi:type IV pilus modification PilV family protein [Chromobacterium paludis]|nr:prepilin-type N-terminal cleavage/methylation domain-containing protein [Chromobacterium paludis]